MTMKIDMVLSTFTALHFSIVQLRFFDRFNVLFPGGRVGLFIYYVQASARIK